MEVHSAEREAIFNCIPEQTKSVLLHVALFYDGPTNGRLEEERGREGMVSCTNVNIHQT
jgi:hypothetical protein